MCDVHIVSRVSCEEDFLTQSGRKKINLDIIFMGTKLYARFEDFSSSLLFFILHNCRALEDAVSVHNKKSSSPLVNDQLPMNE